jgi:hypothetical protein
MEAMEDEMRSTAEATAGMFNAFSLDIFSPAKRERRRTSSTVEESTAIASDLS